MRCPVCGAEMPDGAAFCGVCGNMMGQNMEQPGSMPPMGDPVMNQPEPMPTIAPPVMNQTGSVPPPPSRRMGQTGFGGPPPGPMYEPSAPQKKSPLVPILISVIAILVIAVVVILLVVLGNDDKNSGNGEGNPVAEATETPKEDNPTQEPVATPEPEIEESTPEPVEETPEPVASPEEIAMQYSTEKRPNVGDFEWFYTLYYESNPGRAIRNFFSQAGATTIDNPGLVEGGWKAYMVGKPDEYHEDGYRYLNVILKNNEDQTKVQATFDWWTMGDSSGAESNEEGYDDSTYTCKWNGTGFSDGQLDMTDFIEMDDVQYGLGTYVWESGETDYVVLVRERRF